MKKALLVLLTVTMILSAVSCSEKSSAMRKEESGSVTDVIEDRAAEYDAGSEDEALDSKNNKENSSSKKKSGKADVDLTSLSSTMVYGEVYDMMVSPEDYVGKTIKMGGECYIFRDDSTGNVYYSCIIQDATACCSQGIEFILDDGYDMPDDYPEKGDYVVIEGVFDTYYEGERQYCTLRDAEWLN